MTKALSEVEWIERYRDLDDFEDDGDHKIVMHWHDPTETPRECIVRLNREVAEAYDLFDERNTR